MDILSIVLITLVVVISSCAFYVSIKNKGLRLVVINLIVEAEKIFQYGKNNEKFNYVFENLYARLPTLIKILLTKEDIMAFIQKVFDEIKISLDYQNDQ
ncbi:MAG: hypothetical protein PHD15_00065 [Clostridia bacterium]|nr:hypothetical protein [Clostridia bacterium]MDD4386146.1 hypothetical protein [Clostridia bacterium]